LQASFDKMWFESNLTLKASQVTQIAALQAGKIVRKSGIVHAC
jgi:hypothetical protein